MLNFNTIECQVSEDSLKLRKDMEQKKEKRNIKFNKRKIKI